MKRHMMCSGFVLFALLAATAGAASMPTRARLLVLDRNQLQQQLLQADQQAAESMLQGEDPIETFARQTGLQEQIDMLQMRLESLAMRLDFDIPDLPTSLEQLDAMLDPARALDAKVAIGRHRAEVAKAARCRTASRVILDRLNFASFLDF